MGKKTSTSTSQVSIPPEVLERYNEVNKRAEDVAANPFKKYGTTAEDFVAQLNEQQRTGIANVNTAAGAAQPYIDAATVATTAGMSSAQPGELEIAKYMNPYQQQVIDATMRQLAQSNEQAQSGALGTAISSGAFGGDRAGIAAANLANQQGMVVGSTLAGLNAQNYGQAVETAQQQQGVTLSALQADLARYLQGGGQLANLGVTAQDTGLKGAEAQINAGTLEQNTEQAGKDALINQFMQEQGYPFQVAQFLANIALGTGTASGSTTTTTQPASFFSDRRLKEDIKRIGKTDDGLPIYSFKYKGDDAEQTHVGFMADEVEKVKPEAVGLHPSGYKTVDYAKATESSMGGGVKPGRAGQRFAGGGVAGPYGSPVGAEVNFGGYVPQAYLPVGDLLVADPAIMDAARQSMAQQLASISAVGDSVKSLDETWQWAKDKWGNEGREGELGNAESSRGVARASGGAAYLQRHPTGGLVPRDMRTYLSDTLESQGDAEKYELKTAEGGGRGGKSPAENIADFAKMGMMLFGFRDGGRIGYQAGGLPEEETTGEKVSRLTYPARDLLTRKLPLGALSLGAAAPAATSDVIGLGASALGFPRAGDFMLNTADTLWDYQNRASEAANAPARPYGAEPPREMTPQDMREMERAASEGRAAIAGAPSSMTMAPPRFQGDTRDPLQPVPRAGLGLDTEYGKMLRDPSAFLPPERDVPEVVTAPAPAPTVGGGLVPAAGTPLAPSGGLVPAAGTPLAPSGGLTPAAGTPLRSEGLGAASAQPISIASSDQGSGAPATVQRDGTAYDNLGASNFFYTRMVPQESGGRQFDQDGNPLRSSAGAIGAAQVMEGTGPEAAALAGLEWDRERWLNDKDYNLKLGEAYFLEQYRRFGSLDKAAAAYNAGPGALASAMDRAAALGGNYLDYLPKETQNYVASTTGLGGLGGAGRQGGDGRGLGRAILTSDKPYEDRTTLGKMFYNEDGTVNRNALLSLASGVGSMLASPSQFFLPSLGLGLQGAASTYAGLEKQAADIGLTKAEERRVQIEADKGRIFEGSNGMLLINLGDGRPPVSLFDYMENPTAYSTGDPQLDAQIMREAQVAASRNPQPEGVFADPGVQTLLKREAQNANRNPNAAVAQSAPIEAAINASASIARSSIPSILTQADAVSALTSPDAKVRAGALGPLKQNVANYLNDISQTLTQILNLPPDQALPTIGDPSGGDAAANAQEILKVAVETGMINANGIQELQTIMAAQPNVSLAAETNSALMAGLLVSGRADMRRADFMRDYKMQPGNTQRTVIDAGQAFQEMYGDQIVAEKAALKELIHYGSQPMPPEWAAVLGDYKTPMEFLMTPGIPVEAKNEFISKLLPALGVNEMVISALQGPDGMYIGNYFGG